VIYRGVRRFSLQLQLLQKVAVLLHAEMSVVGRRMYIQVLMVLRYGMVTRFHRERRHQSLSEYPATSVVC
jgi:hypothetical protein